MATSVPDAVQTGSTPMHEPVLPWMCNDGRASHSLSHSHRAPAAAAESLQGGLCQEVINTCSRGLIGAWTVVTSRVSRMFNNHRPAWTGHTVSARRHAVCHTVLDASRMSSDRCHKLRGSQYATNIKMSQWPGDHPIGKAHSAVLCRADTDPSQQICLGTILAVPGTVVACVHVWSSPSHSCATEVSLSDVTTMSTSCHWCAICLPNPTTC